MANVNIELGYKTLIWFNANPTLVLLAGQIVYLEQTGTYKIGDGVSTLSVLSFLGISSETQTLQNVTDLGNTTTNDIQFDTGVGVLLDNTSRLREGTIDAGYGGAKGIAQICAVGYELKWESGTLYVMDGNGTHIRHSLYNFASIPSATEDISKGFLVGTRWSLDNGDVYVCTDNTITAAVWVLEASDFTSAEKTKLSGIATGAEVNVNADWNATSGDAEILNKPTIGVGDMTKAVYDVDNTGIVDNAEAIIIVGRNATGSTLRKGTIIYILGSTGNRPNFVKAQANSEATSTGTFGVIVNDIANNTDGNCCVLGYLDTLDTRTTATYPFTTDTLADGDTIYLSPTTAGYITNVKPSAPNHLVYLGKVTRTSPTNGTIIYRIQNGYELEELHNVAIASVANNDVLTYESSTSLWKNKTVVSALGFTPYNATNPSGYITGITSENVTMALGYIPVNDTLPKIYHVLRWFTPSSTVSSSGTTVTSIGTQFTSGMVNAKLTILGEARIITAFISSTQVTVASAYSTNYSGVASGSWGVYNIAYEITSAGFQYFYGYNSNNVGGYERVKIGSDLFCYENTSLSNYWQLTGVIKGLGLNNDGKVAWSSTNNVTQTKDLGLWRNSAGVVEINDGSTVATGLLANRRDLLVRNVRASSLTLDLAPFTITGSNNTGQTASTAISGWNYIGNYRTWLAGNITTQNENVWGAVTYNFGSASIITNAYGNVFNAPIAGTNATITNNFSALFNQQISLTQTVTTETVVQTRTVTIVINGTTYKLLAA